MQNKGTIQFFTILLILATVYVLSFSFVTNSFEKEAYEIATAEFDELSDAASYEGEAKNTKIKSLQQTYLRSKADSAIYPVLGKTYREVKEHELNLGLDLQGGMAVTLEVPVDEILTNFSDDTDYVPFQEAVKAAKLQLNDSQDDYMTLFEAAWESKIAGEANPRTLSEIFNNYEYQDKFSQTGDDAIIIKELREQVASSINSTTNIIRKRIDQFGVAQPNITTDNSGRIIVELPGADDRERIIKLLKTTAKLEFWETYFPNEVGQAFQAAEEAYAKRLYPQAFVEDSITGMTDDEAKLKLQHPLTSMLIGIGSQSAIGAFKVTDVDKVNKILEAEEFKTMLPADLMLRWAAKSFGVTLNEGEEVQVLALHTLKDPSRKGKPKLDGSSIIAAASGFDEFGSPEVTMRMDGPGSAIWGEITTAAANDNNRCVAIVLDNQVQSAPHVNSPILGGSSSISMGGSTSTAQGKSDADDLAGLLEAGSLDVTPIIVDEYSVGPSLGEKNIKNGLMSFVIALILIMLYMIFYYRGAGVVAVFSLIINLLLLIGALASLGAALTLPGIAGIVLTIGMAVDANVLIFERVREELRHGKTLTHAVQDGFNAALSAILDANVTTLLTAIILIVFGSGPIKGFATTLIIGIFTSLFSAVLISKLIIFSRLEKKKPMTFSSKLTENWLANTNVQFIANRKKFYMISGVVLLLAIGSLVSRGVQYGIDFNGGSKKEVAFNSTVNHQELIDAMKEGFTNTDGTVASTNITSIGSGNTNYKITTSYLIDTPSKDIDELIDAAYKKGLDKMGVGYDVLSTSKVSGSISDDFRRGATYATIFSLLVIFLYIFFRFKKWTYGAGALIALTHDVIIVLGLFALFKGIVPFTLEVNQAFIAAILTVIGYSINDTVVVFDRIREFLGLRRNQDEKEVINQALNSTLSRTVNTSMTTFLVLLMIFIFGGDDIRGFTFALMLGVIVGTYSSIFIATPAVVDLSKSAREEE